MGTLTFKSETSIVEKRDLVPKLGVLVLMYHLKDWMVTML